MTDSKRINGCTGLNCAVELEEDPAFTARPQRAPQRQRQRLHRQRMEPWPPVAQISSTLESNRSRPFALPQPHPHQPPLPRLLPGGTASLSSCRLETTKERSSVPDWCRPPQQFLLRRLRHELRRTHRFQRLRRLCARTRLRRQLTAVVKSRVDETPLRLALHLDPSVHPHLHQKSPVVQPKTP
jgi:hypothetical protein